MFLSLYTVIVKLEILLKQLLTIPPTVFCSCFSVPDYFRIIYSLDLCPPPILPLYNHLTCSVHSINVISSIQDIFSSYHLSSYQLAFDVVDCFKFTSSSYLIKLVHLTSYAIHPRPPNPCLTPALDKLAKHHTEQVWSRSHFADDLGLLGCNSSRASSNHTLFLSKSPAL